MLATPNGNAPVSPPNLRPSSTSFAGAPCPKAKCGMVEDDNTDGPFTIRAANLRLDPPEVVEVCHSKSAMQTRAADLYRAGYEVEVVKPARAKAADQPDRESGSTLRPLSVDT